MTTDIKTFKGFIGLLRKAVNIDVELLKGYEALTDDHKKELSFIIGELNDALSQVSDIHKNIQNGNTNP